MAGSKNRRNHSIAFKQKVVRTVLSGELRKFEAAKRFKLWPSLITGWIRDPRNNPALLAPPATAEPVRPVGGPPSSNKGLRARVEVLERALGKQLVEDYLRKQGV